MSKIECQITGNVFLGTTRLFSFEAISHLYFPFDWLKIWRTKIKIKDKKPADHLLFNLWRVDLCGKIIRGVWYNFYQYKLVLQHPWWATKVTPTEAKNQNNSNDILK